MYILLSGKPPFDGNDDEEILRAVDKARVSYSDEVWKKVSPEGKDLLKKMLEKNYKKRISAVECLEHPWFAKFLASQDLSTQESNEANMNIMANIKSFTGRLKMQQAALSFISVHLMSNEEQEQMRKVFQSIDKDFDGVLDRQELIEGLKKMGIENPSAEADRIFEMADLDQNGTIEFSEWVTATMDKRQMLNKQRLKAAFDMFDRNQDGTISFEEVREILGGGKKSDSASDNMFKEMIREMDVDGDGQISYEEFEQMMTQMIQGKQ